MTKQVVRLKSYQQQLLRYKNSRILESNPMMIEQDCQYCFGEEEKDCYMCKNTKNRMFQMQWASESYTPIYEKSDAKFDYRLDEEEIICECGKRVLGRLCECGAMYDIEVTLKVDKTHIGDKEFWRQQSEEEIKRVIKYSEIEIAKMEAEE